MSSSVQSRPRASWGQLDLARLYCRLTVLFAIQGAILLALYALMGFDTHPDALPPGLRLDPFHSVIHLLFGVAGSYVGFWKPGASLRFTQLFGLFYLLLALLGTFSDLHFGMQLELEENALHWALGLIAALIGFGGPLFSTWARKE